MRTMDNCTKVLAWLLALLLTSSVLAKAPDKNDIRVLIDISGSMATNDPANLRRPALRMLVGLMQPGTRAGVWTFAKWSNPLVPVADIDDAWKQKALALSRQINSPGQFTHVERVLEDAIADWSGEPSTHNRHLVLLTDGMVDVSKVAGESAASRQRILEQLLPRLKQLGIKVHTIALSKRADHDLMKQLSNQTDGWYQQVESADTLQRVFLKMFEQVGKPDSVPLAGNRFTVDASVREATVLLFRGPGSQDPVLISPSGERFSDSDLPAGVAWYRDQGYDLITVSSPNKGEWSLEADVDPDNRVMIVTDLKLETSEVPAHIAVGEQVGMIANLNNKGQLVRRKAFLRLLDVRADAMTQAGTDPQGLNDAGQDGDQVAADGRYSMLYREDRAFEEVELLFSVESPTFMREKRYRLAVHEPASLSVEGEGEDVRALVTIEPAVMRDNAEITIWQADPSGGKRDLSAAADGQGYLLVDPKAPVHMQISGQTKLGNLVKRSYGPVYPPSVEPPVQTAPQPVQPQQAQAALAAQPEPAADPATPAPQPQETAEEESDFVMPAIMFGSANLLLMLIGGGVWWWMRKRRNGDEDDTLLEEFVEEEAETEEASAEQPEDQADKAEQESEQETAEGDSKGEAA